MMHSKSKSKVQKITILYLKDRQNNMSSTSDQTKKIRDKINLKIKELGDKYFQVKAVFDQLNLHRDHLFLKGKELEELFKDQKIGLHLQTQSCRMKEALYCWYAENFYNEIFETGPLFLNFLQKEVSEKEFKKARKTTEVNKVPKAIKSKNAEVKRRNYNESPLNKSNALTAHLSSKANHVKQNENNKQSHVVYLRPILPQINQIHQFDIDTQIQQFVNDTQIQQFVNDTQIQQFVNDTTIHETSKKEEQKQQVQQIQQDQEQLVIHDQEKLVQKDQEDIHNYKYGEDDNAYIDVFQSSIDDVDIIGQNNNLFFDYSDIFYFQS